MIIYNPKTFKPLCFILLSITMWLQFSCTPNWTNAIQYGSLDARPFHEMIEIEVANGLIIMPVQLNGKSYRFLFDTGAPNSVSRRIQNDMNYKVVSRGHIVDSDKNREKVEYVRIDSLFIGSVPFLSQTAFVGDFDRNPLFKCLSIDGIVGSNLMRFCNWTIDYKSKTIVLTTESLDNSTVKNPEVAFETDNQYNLLVELKTKNAKIRNVTIDYGSNGSLSLPNNVYQVLKEQNDLNRSYKEIGVSQSGIVGAIKELDREIVYVDTLWLNNEFAKNIQLQSNSSALLGSKVLSNWVITIDWKNHKLYLEEKQNVHSAGTHGFGIGYSNEKGAYIQSVIVDGPAYKKGMRPGMKVLQINDATFNGNDSFCALANSMGEVQDTLFVTFEGFNKNTERVTLHKKILE